MAIFSLRWPDELYKALKEIAKEERTINTWIVNILKRYEELMHDSNWGIYFHNR